MTALRRLLTDRRGTVAVEFALVVPSLLLLTAGGMELVHMKFVQTVLVGEVQKAGRDISLESSATAARRTAIFNRVTRSVRAIAPGVSVDYSIKSFHDYANVASPAEEFSDTDRDGRCDNGENFIDSNGNGVWDADGAVDGRGGGKDVVVLTATLSYPRLSLGSLFGGTEPFSMSARTVLRNQPTTAQTVPAVGICA
ncbi:MAG: pilus assembly protein [Sphingomonadales bacterium]|nr:pilus assembly protein [Sphingomonadales bacterium]